MSPINRRDVALRAAFEDEEPVKPIVMVCAWCRDAHEQSASARAHGFDVTHGICPSCEEQLLAEAGLGAVRRV